MAAWFGAGKILPVARGEGKDQPLMLNFGDKLNVGDWVHIFPEGRIWQDHSSPSRDNNGSLFSPSGRKAPPMTKLGPLKWGTAKIIADADVTPVILPIYHFGMEDIFPQDSNNKLISAIPRPGKKIYVKVGDPVNVDDLLSSHRAALSRGRDHLGKGGAVDEEQWAKFVAAEENALHVAITGRVQLSLLKLEAELLELRDATEEGFEHKSYFAQSRDRLRYLRDAVLGEVHAKAVKKEHRINLVHQHVKLAKDIAKERMLERVELARSRALDRKVKMINKKEQIIHKTKLTAETIKESVHLKKEL